MKKKRGKSVPGGRLPTTRFQWEREVKGISKFLAKLEQLQLEQGQDWCDSMVRYYDSRLKALLNHPPPAVQRLAGRKIIRVDIIYGED